MLMEYTRDPDIYVQAQFHVGTCKLKVDGFLELLQPGGFRSLLTRSDLRLEMLRLGIDKGSPSLPGV